MVCLEWKIVARALKIYTCDAVGGKALQDGLDDNLLGMDVSVSYVSFEGCLLIGLADLLSLDPSHNAPCTGSGDSEVVQFQSFQEAGLVIELDVAKALETSGRWVTRHQDI